MLKKLWTRARNRIAGKVGEQNAEMAALLAQCHSLITGLNVALGQATTAAQVQEHERMVFLAAVALQNGGEFVLPRTMIDTVVNGHYQVEVKLTEDQQGVHIRVVTVPEEAST